MANLSAQFPHYGWEHNVGYPTIHHRKAIGMHGPCTYHRMTFRLLKDEEGQSIEEEAEDFGFL